MELLEKDNVVLMPRSESEKQELLLQGYIPQVIKPVEIPQKKTPQKDTSTKGAE